MQKAILPLLAFLLCYNAPELPKHYRATYLLHVEYMGGAWVVREKKDSVSFEVTIDSGYIRMEDIRYKIDTMMTFMEGPGAHYYAHREQGPGVSYGMSKIDHAFEVRLTEVGHVYYLTHWIMPRTALNKTYHYEMVEIK